MTGDLTAPDAGVPGTFAEDFSCGEHADDAITEARARLIFLGNLAGIGDDEDVDTARETLARAIREAGGFGEDEVAQRARIAELTEEWYGMRYGTYNTGRPYPIPEGMTMEERLARVQEIDEEIAGMSVVRDNSPEGVWRRIRSWVSGMASSFRQYYDETVALIAAGRWGAAICRLGVDLVFVAAEEALIWGVTALAGIATAGAATLVVHVTARVISRGSRLATVFVRARRARPSEAAEFGESEVSFGQVDTADPPDQTINRMDDEVGQGTTEPDPESPETERAAISARLAARNAAYDRVRARLTDREWQDAGSAGRSPRNIAARQKLVASYEEEFGQTNIASGPNGNDAGMNISRPMTLRKSPPPERLVTWRNENFRDGLGAFWDPSGGTATPNELGINSVGRQQGIYRNELPALAFEGYGAPIVDNWSVLGAGARRTDGGVLQWHMPDDFKPTPADLDSEGLNWRTLPGNRDWVEAENEGRLRYGDVEGQSYDRWFLDGAPIEDTTQGDR